MPIKISVIHYNKIIFTAECLLQECIKWSKGFITSTIHQGIRTDFCQNRQKPFSKMSTRNRSALLFQLVGVSQFSELCFLKTPCAIVVGNAYIIMHVWAIPRAASSITGGKLRHWETVFHGKSMAHQQLTSQSYTCLLWRLRQQMYREEHSWVLPINYRNFLYCTYSLPKSKYGQLLEW